MADPGRDAYRGFEYQIAVSAWLTLLFLGERHSDAVVIEPLGGEDLEILRRDNMTDDTSDRQVEVQAPGYLVQVKTRRTGAWSSEDLNEILFGKKRIGNFSSGSRVWPLQALQADASKLFLLVTDATVEQSLTHLLVDEVAFKEREVSTTGLPKVLQGDDGQVRSRIGIRQKLPLALVEQLAGRILAVAFHVPFSCQRECFEKIRGRVRAALGDAKQGTITVQEIRDAARACEGMPERLPMFVEPSGFKYFRRRLDDNHALLLLGEPGVGKSTAADQLIFEHRTQPEPFAVRSPVNPRDLRRMVDELARVLVYVEDPFGRYTPDPMAIEWRGELEWFCQHIRNDLRLLVTSRHSFAGPHLSDSIAPRLEMYSVVLREDTYERTGLLD